MSKRGQEMISSEGSPMAKPKPMVPAEARPVNLVSRSPWSARENPPGDRKMLKVQIPGNSVIRRNLQTLLVQGDLYGYQLQEESF